MKKRIIWKMFVLEVITLGIYRLYYLVKTRNEMMRLNPAIKIKSTAYLFAPLILIILAVVGTIIVTALSEGNSGGSSFLVIMGLYAAILLSFVFFVIWEWSYSQGVEVITGEKLSFALALLVLVAVPDGIDILIIQDYFNKVGDQPSQPVQPIQSEVPPSQPPAAI